jgi:hypothetical protein
MLLYALRYGSFVYGFISKFILLVIDPVYNIGISLATGTFCTCCLESLSVESSQKLCSRAGYTVCCMFVISNRMSPISLWYIVCMTCDL